MTMFTDALIARREAINSGLCVGLDIDEDKFPKSIQKEIQSMSCPKDAFKKFIMNIVEATMPYAACYKPNMAFYEGIDDSYGFNGLWLLLEVIEEIYKICPEMPIIIDGKRGDIGNTNKQYAYFFNQAIKINPAIAFTANPYFGREAYKPFFDTGATIFWLVRTSNKGSDEFQNLKLESGEMLWQEVLQSVISWKKPGVNGAVIGATHPDEIEWIMRNIANYPPILLPGIGAQGGDIEATAKILIKFPAAIANSSSGIMFAYLKADDPENADYAQCAAEAAKQTMLSLRV